MATLLDQYGRPIETPRRPETGRVAVGSIWDRWSSYPSHGLTPQRLTAILREADDGDVTRQAELFAEMEEKDTHLASVLQTRRSAVVGLPRRVLPYSDAKEDQEAAALVEEVLEQLDLDDVLQDLMDAVGKGFSVAEIIWESGARAAPRAIEWVDPRKFVWRGNELRLLTDGALTDGEALGANKWIIHRHKARSGAAARAGMLRVCSWMFLFKNWAIKDWMGFLEIFGIPLRVGKYDPSATAKDKEDLFRTLVSIASDAAGMIPSNAEIEFVEAGKASGRSGDVFERLVAFAERSMSKAVLGQTLTTDTTGGTGTYAAGEVHNEVRHDLRNSDAKALAKTVGRDLIRPIVGFNLGWDRTARLPYLEFDTAEPEDLASLSNTYAVLREKVGLPIGRAHVYERFGIPAPEKNEELVDGPASAQPAPSTWPMTAMRGRASGVAHAARTDAVQAAVDGLADAAIEEGAAAVQAMVDPIVAAVEAATDYDDLRDRLLAAYPELDATAMEDVLARAMFMAELGGRANAR